MQKDSKKLENDKEDLIDIIEWYRDKYFTSNMKNYCNELIVYINKIDDSEVLEIYTRLVDDWIDGPPDI